MSRRVHDSDAYARGIPLRIAARLAWADWLQQFWWQWFVTLTFAESMHPEEATKRFNQWIAWLNRKAYSRGWRLNEDGVFWVLATEFQRRGVVHFHALIGDVEDLNGRVSRRAARNVWYPRNGLARVDAIDDGISAITNYVSKYVAKGGELEVSSSMRRYREQRPMGLNLRD